MERLRKELEDKFLELGPDTVIGCKVLLFFGCELDTDEVLLASCC